jgi:hypothetical protein
MIFDIKYYISKFCDKKTSHLLRVVDTEFKYIIDKQIFQDCINCNKKTLIKKCKTCNHVLCFDCFVTKSDDDVEKENKYSKYCSECFIGYCDLCENEIHNEYGIDIYALPDEDNPRMGCSVRSRRDYYYDKVLKKCGNIICNECKTDCIYCRTCIDCEVKCISCNDCLRCLDFCDMCGNCTDCTNDPSNDCENCKEYKSDKSESDEYEQYNSDKSESDESDESEYEFELHI